MRGRRHILFYLILADGSQDACCQQEDEDEEEADEKLWRHESYEHLNKSRHVVFVLM